MRRLGLLLAVVALAGCGGSSNGTGEETTATTLAVPDPAAAVGGTTLYRGGNWAVVVNGSSAVALHLTDGAWHPDRTARVKVDFLGPAAIAAPRPQVAAELHAPGDLVESGLWVDGQELLVKGGGLSPTRGTIYGAPAGRLAPGRHLAVAYARTASTATAVAHSFRVR